MYQESNTANSSKKSDMLLFIGLIALLLVSRFLLSLLQAIGGGPAQLVIFVVLVAICFMVFKRRFCTYRYTLFNKEPEPDELDEYGNPSKLPFPLGTFIIEQLSGSRGGVMANIAPGDMLQLIPPSGAAAIGIIGGDPKDSSLKKPPLYANGNRENAHILLYRQDGKTKALAFAPGAELAKMLSDIIAAVNA